MTNQQGALQYADRDHTDLGSYYLRHVSAMTGEALHSKSAIAAELAHRDREIDRLQAENANLNAGYTAARLEIESLQSRIKTMAEEHADELMVAHLDGRMRAGQPAPVMFNGLTEGETMETASCAGLMTQPAGEYPALPDAAGVVVERVPVGGGWVRHYQGDSYTADQMRAYVDADRATRAAHGQAPAQASSELTETAVTAKNPAAPVSSFEDSRTQAAYEVLVNDNYPPAGSNEHWEGWKARLIVDALFQMAAPAAVAGPSETHEAMCPALTGGRCTCERNDPAVDKAWARFCGGIGDGPDAPYPGMISAFERYYSQSFTDKDWRNEASVWAAAWKQALLTAAAPAQPAPQLEVQEPVAWYVTGCGRLLDEDEAKAEARRIGGTARAIPLYTVPQADSQPAPVREEEREAFKAAHRHLELDEVPDAWGRPMFKYSHVEASWLGWIARAARAPADSVLEDAARWTTEQEHAIRQGHEIAASDGYFEARPQIDSNDRRKVFQAGFERGWDAARKQGANHD